MDEAMEKRLIEAYRAELLENPPVRALSEEAPNREGAAWGIGGKDVRRLVKALSRAGLMIVEASDGEE
jgi:hypothetical protein